MNDYPDAERLDLVENIHGYEIADPYRWLEDPADPRTVSWSAAQDRLAREHLDALPDRAAWTARVDSLVRTDSVGVPHWRNGRAFFTRQLADQEHRVLWVREPDGTERVLLDVHAADPTGKTVLDHWSPSREGTRLAYLTSIGGDEESRLFVLDVDTGELLDGPIDRTKFTSVAWLPGGEELIYERRLSPHAVPPGEESFHRRVWRHKVGGDPDETDVLLHGDGGDATMIYDVSTSGDGRWLVITGNRGTARNDWLWLADLHNDEGAREIVHYDDQVRAEAWVERDGRLYIRTTYGAGRGRLCVADPAAPEMANWTELVPEDPDAVLGGVRYLPGPDRPELIVQKVRHAVAELHRYDAVTGRHIGTIPLPGLGSVFNLSTVDDATAAGRDTVWIGWSDFRTPPTVIRWSVTRGVPEPPAAGAAAGIAAHVRQVEYPSRDGTTVRMFVLAPTAAPDRPRPALLTGYGGFAISRLPEYTPYALAWVAGGGVFALASLRGGDEEGEEWHEAGMREHKQNVFDDFHAAADHLVAAGWTSRERLGIMGGSNGGLLVGAALTQRPAAYRAVVCAKPLLDMARYERFLIGRFWSHEYGTAADPEELGWLLDYSPYHKVESGTRYPAVLFTSYENDSRTDPCHPRKMCAAVQYATSGDLSTRPVLLRRETDVGHGDRSATRTVDLTVDMLAFLSAYTKGAP